MSDQPEKFEEFPSRAHEWIEVRTAQAAYETRGWATPISGDATTIRRKFL